MKIIFIFIGFFCLNLLYSPDACSQATSTQDKSQSISLQKLKEIVYALASDSMQGRKSGERGLQLAEVYLTKTFREIGLDPTYKNSYLQKFYLLKDTSGIKSMQVDGTKFEYGKDFFLHFIVKPPFTHQKLEFKGIMAIGTNPKQWHFSKKDVRNKLLLLFPGTYAFKDSSDLSGLKDILLAARKSGAAGLIIPTTRFDHLPQNGDINDIMEVMRRLPHYHSEFPVVYMSWKALDKLLGHEKLMRLLSLYKKGSSDFASAFNESMTIKLNAGNMKVKKVVSNIIGYVPGKGKINEFVIVGAHYDHIGWKPGKNRAKIDYYNGADDNASGTAGLLEMARVFAAESRKGNPPARTIVFIAFSAEEDGLLGSNIYVENPAFPLDSTSAMINMDMIGRTNKQKNDYVYAIGYDYISSDWKKLLHQTEKEFPDLNLDLTFNKSNDPDQYFKRSDQYHFARKGVPVLFFFDDMQKDYHGLNDTEDKINYPLLQKRTAFIYTLVKEIANRPKMLNR